MEDKRNNPSNYAIMTISEGAIIEGLDVVETGEADAYGHRKFGGVGEIVSEEIKKRTGQDIMYQVVAYLMRSGAPDSLDRMVAMSFGNLAMQLIRRNETGKMVALHGGKYTTVPIDMILTGKKRVDVPSFYDVETLHSTSKRFHGRTHVLELILYYRRHDMSKQVLDEVLSAIDHSIEYSDGKVTIKNEKVLRAKAYRLAEISALDGGEKAGWARYITRLAAAALGTYPASINELYMARGAGKVPNTFTVPAINLRVLAFDCARAVFRAAGKINAGAVIFEIARSEMTYTDQRPSEFTTSVLAAALAENYAGPIFLQGDHFQVSPKKYAADPNAELEALRTLIREAVAGGYLNIDVDTSTLVDLSKTTIPEQQEVNTELSAMLTAYIRSDGTCRCGNI